MIGSQEPTLKHLPSDRRGSAGPEAIELAAAAGLYLDPWQCFVLEHGLAEGSDGKWSAFECLEVVTRQNGKNGVLEARQLAGLFLFGERLQVHSAHEFKTCLEHFLRIKTLIESTPDLDRQVRIIRTGSADMSIELLTGQRLRFVARTASSGAGLTGDTVYLDEAWALQFTHMGQLVPTMRARPNPQLWYASSAPKKDSVILHGLLKRAEQSVDEEPDLMAACWENPEGTDPADVKRWYVSNPAMGIRISERQMHRELRLHRVNPDLLAEFLRECVGVRESPPDEQEHKPTKIDFDRWKLTAINRDAATALSEFPRAIAYAVSKDGEWATIAIAAGSLRVPYVEIIEHRRGTAWLGDRLAELCDTHELEVVGTNAYGPGGAAVGPILAAFAEAETEATVKQLSATEYMTACQAMWGDIHELDEETGRPRLQRVADGQDPLVEAAIDATERVVGRSGWAWDARHQEIPICPLEAVTIARALLPVDADVVYAPMFARS